MREGTATRMGGKDETTAKCQTMQRLCSRHPLSTTVTSALLEGKSLLPRKHPLTGLAAVLVS